MKCPQCIKDNTRSQVFPGGAYRTLMGGLNYYDEDGKHHDHYPNYTIENYQCSLGHKWTEKRHSRCPVELCIWNNNVEDEVKIEENWGFSHE